jgi:Flp pilus assembly protein TadG
MKSPEKLTNLNANESGQAGFETMLVLPFFLLFILLAVDFGIWGYQAVTVSNAVREAARYAAVNCPDDGGCDAAAVADKAVAKSSGVLSATEITVGWIGRGSAAAGDKHSSVVVKANHPYDFLFFPVTFGANACADMRLERDEASSVPAGTDC